VSLQRDGPNIEVLEDGDYGHGDRFWRRDIGAPYPPLACVTIRGADQFCPLASRGWRTQ